jgi:hypothetical protein
VRAAEEVVVVLILNDMLFESYAALYKSLQELQTSRYLIVYNDTVFYKWRDVLTNYLLVLLTLAY